MSNDMITCVCGSFIEVSGLNKHMSTKKHIKFIGGDIVDVKTRRCDVCDKDIKYFSWIKHIKSKAHLSGGKPKKIIIDRSIKISCECGCLQYPHNMKRHLLTKKHKKLMILTRSDYIELKRKLIKIKSKIGVDFVKLMNNIHELLEKCISGIETDEEFYIINDEYIKLLDL